MPDIRTCNDLESHLKLHHCTTKDEFEAKQAVNPDQFTVLQIIPHIYKSKRTAANGMVVEETVVNPAFVFSSPNVLKNIEAAYRGKPEGINISIDGTYKTTRIGWTLIPIGTTGVYYDQAAQKWRQRFYPFMYLFCPTELGESITIAFQVLMRVSSTFFGIESLPVRVLQTDHC